MKLPLLLSALTLAACAGAAPAAPVQAPTTTSATAPPVEPVVPTEAEPAPAPLPPPAEAAAEPCGTDWVCLKVSLATRKIVTRETKLLGDPKIESTWSKRSDGRTVSLDEFSKGPLELTLRRGANNKNEVVIKLAKGGAPLVIDKHDGSVDDFTHVAVIATEQDGALLVDLRYMR